MNKIVRQHEIRDGITFTQWQDGDFTCHDEGENKQPVVIGHIPYKKETDFEWYPHYRNFMDKIAENAWGYAYIQAHIKGLLPPTPPPVKPPKDYRKRKESANEDESET